ncbi:MAG: hypothetical protein GF375_02230 [Candidatus Omnitrophica bacterium]|nr:hypothetical protein [Candidatus Omnitrophota bacterium]MBD3268932.1 hypothetical protein [Candidatus Omnitrophota bacterium]
MRRIPSLDIEVSPVCLGTWAFGGDKWWGKQEDKDSMGVLHGVVERGINFIDTAPVYGRGRSERVIGGFFKKTGLREKIILATKVGLSWEGPRIIHNLSARRMGEEVDESRKRLKTDYLDLYQVHWPDPHTPIGETAEMMYSFYKNGTVKSIGVSNYSVSQMQEFRKYSPLHCLQPEYSMFNRSIEKETVNYCLENNIAIISYAPLYSGLLTGKFFLNGAAVPEDINRKMKSKDLSEPLYSINKTFLLKLDGIASKYGKTLTQLAINWNFSQRGIISSIVGMRNEIQAEENLGSMGWSISDDDKKEIDSLLAQRSEEINSRHLF